MKLKRTLLLFLILTLTTTCDKKPSAPEYDNPFDNQNPNTDGDPFQLTAAIAGGGITLSWTTPQVNSLTGFKIYRSETVQSGYILLQLLDKTKNSYVDKNIENGHSYWYRISAVNDKDLETAYTNTAAVNIVTSPALVINGDAEFTPSRIVNLTILANTASQMILSNNSDFSGANWEDYATSKEWVLPIGAGEKIIFLRVKYADNSESTVLSDTINPLPINPGLVIAGNAEYTPSRVVRLTLSASGTNLQMKIGENASLSGVNWQTYSDTSDYPLSTGAGMKRVYALIKNDFEIESDVVYDDINPQPMNPGIVINNNAAFVLILDVQLALNASGSNLQIKISEDSTFTGVVWQPWTTPINYQLSSGDGIKTVYAQFKNDFEIESEKIADEIILDTTPPHLVLTISPDSGFTNETEFQFDPTASTDNLTPYLDLQVRFDWQDDGSFDTPWGSLQVFSHLFDTGGGGNKAVRMQLRDAAGWEVDTTKILFVNSRPVASFTATRDAANYKLYHFNASASSDYEDGSDLNYRWDFNDDSSWEIDFNPDNQADHEYLSDGDYTVVMEVMDNNNATDRMTLSIHVSTEPLQMVYVNGGTFTMGDTWGDGLADEKPTHLVTLNSFYISRYEVTQALWQQVMGTTPSYFSGPNRPVEQVNWYDAVDFCNTLSQQAGLNPCYIIDGIDVTCDFYATGYRLPTEAEWEYAARGGILTQGYKYSGSNDSDLVAWYQDNSGSQSHDVGTKQPNELGLYDMSGNVWEWCWDWYGAYSSDAQTNPIGNSTGLYRVLRGSSWHIIAEQLRVCGVRGYNAPENKTYHFGFRVVRR